MVYPFLDSLIQVDHEGTLGECLLFSSNIGKTIFSGAGWKEIRSVVSTIFTSGKMKKVRIMSLQLEKKLSSNLLAFLGTTFQTQFFFRS